MQDSKPDQMDIPLVTQAQQLLDGKCKPPGSLGTLEKWAIQLCTLQQTLQPHIISAKLLIFAADHGITADTPTVSAYPRAVTPAVFKAIAAGGAASSVLCTQHDIDLELIDVGINSDVSAVQPGNDRINVVHAKVAAHGSASMAAGPAMTADQMAAALLEGRQAVLRAVSGVENPSHTVLCIGEIGIGNTTAAAAILAAFTALPPEDVCGRGTGLDSTGLLSKRATVAQALSTNVDLIKGGRSNAPGVLQAVGGLEIAAMVGAYLEAADLGVPVMVDGFVSGAAALIARWWYQSSSGGDGDISIDSDRGGGGESYCTSQFKGDKLHTGLHYNSNVQVTEECTGYKESKGTGELWKCEQREHAVCASLFWSHTSDELAAKRLLEAAGVEYDPPLQMRMRLGEGTGAVLAVPLLKSAAAIARDMASLEEALTL